MWPSFVETTLKTALCENAFANDAVQVVRTAPSTAHCASLIRNGNMQDSYTDYPYWLHSEAGIKVVPGAGLNGTNAIATVDSNSSDAYIAQYIDIRCLERGAVYDVRAYVRLEHLNGSPFSCNDGVNCPEMQLHMRTPVDDIGSNFQTEDLDVAIEFVQPYDNNGWNLLQGTITITAPLAAASSVWVSIDRRRANVNMFVDNVSMTRVTPNCNNLVSNGDFGQGTSIFWGCSEPLSSSKLGILTTQGDHALRISNRTLSTAAIVQNIATGCMAKGGMYLARAKIRVLNNVSGDFACNPVASAGASNACPRMRLKSTADRDLVSEASITNTIAKTEHGTISDNGVVWRTMSGIFMATDIDGRADEAILSIDGVAPQNSIVVDNVSLTPLALNCSELILNGNAEAGPTAQFWDTATTNQNVVIQVIQSNNSSIFYIKGRTSSTDGLAQSIDPRCMKVPTMWDLKAQMKLITKSTGVPVKCETDYKPLSIACPYVRVVGSLNGVQTEAKEYKLTNQTFAWVANAMNDYVVKKIPVSSVMATSDKIVISFKYSSSWEMQVDNISMKPSL
jgi:hypothetical protein